MATSGTVGATAIDVTTLIEHAFRRCGKLPSTISSELQLGAKESLFFLLTSLVNSGLSLWCINKYVIPLASGVSTYPLLAGTADVLNVQFRTYTVLSGTVTTGCPSGKTVQTAGAGKNSNQCKQG